MPKLIIANWKCNPVNRREAKQLLAGLNRGLKKLKKRPEVVICPPFCYLSDFRFRMPDIKLGAQDVFWEREGAFTGEISVLMLKDLGAKYVLVGHSERRALGETDEMVNKKIKAGLKAGLVPVLCVGEHWEERKDGRAFETIKEQLGDGLKGTSRKEMGKIIIAYEPIWAIGPGQPCLPDGAETMALFIKKTIRKMAGRRRAGGVRVLYGGSVEPENGSDYLKSPWLDGLLIGGASLKVMAFLQIAEKAV